MKKLSIVIPCYGSEKTLPGVVRELQDTLVQRAELSYEIILVCDGSPDGVYDVIQAMATRDRRIRGILFVRNFGQPAAVMAGLRCASGDVIVALDDDGQTPANELFSLTDELERGGHDVVFAQYEVKRHSAFRNFGTWMNNEMAHVLIEKPKDVTLTSYFACRALIAKEICRYENAFPYIDGLLLRTTKRIGTVPVHHRSRTEGRSGYTLHKLIRQWMDGFTAFSVKPLRFATVTGVLCAVAGFIYGLIIIIQKLVTPSMPEGYASMMALLLFVCGMIMFMLGLLGEYIGRIYISLNASPQYIIRETCNVERPEGASVNQKV